MKENRLKDAKKGFQLGSIRKENVIELHLTGSFG